MERPLKISLVHFKDREYKFRLVYLAKNLPAVQGTWVQSLGWEDLLEEGHGNPVQYSCLENPHGQRSLAGYNPWGCEESDMTERLSIAQQPLMVDETPQLFSPRTEAFGHLAGSLQEEGFYFKLQKPNSL